MRDAPFTAKIYGVRHYPARNFHIDAHIDTGECIETAANTFIASVRQTRTTDVPVTAIFDFPAWPFREPCLGVFDRVREGVDVCSEGG